MQDVGKLFILIIQDPMLAPPEMPTIYMNNSEGSRLSKVDEKLLASYEKKCNQVNTGIIICTDIPKRNIGYWMT
jgi:hypothetical protein